MGECKKMSEPAPSGDHTELLRLYSKNEVALRSYVRSILPTRLEASEVMQEVIIALWQKFETARDFRP
jgi:RNA polymerase sigma-70 factor (ECF subfamily)